MNNSNRTPEKAKTNFFMWLGEEGEAVEVTEEQMEQLQRNWKGKRPADYEEGLGD